MENNIDNNMGGNNVEQKKNNSIITIIIIVIILVIIAIIVFRKIRPEQTLSQTDIELNQAIATDSTKSIIDNLNSINLDDTSDADLISVDQELGKL